MPNHTDKSIEQWLWDAACSIRGAKDAPKYRDYILPLVFAKCLCDVFDDEINRIVRGEGADLAPAQSRAKAFKLVARDKKLALSTLRSSRPMPMNPSGRSSASWLTRSASS
jgi:type I restriction enzyme M protein